MIRQLRLALIVFQWWFWKTVSLDFYKSSVKSSICVQMNVGRFHLLPLGLGMFGRVLRLKAPPAPLARLLSVVSEIFEKFADHLFSWFLVWFLLWFSDLLEVVSNRTAYPFHRSEATFNSCEHDIIEAFDKVWYPDLLHNLKSYGMSGWLFDLSLSSYSVKNGFEWFWMGNGCKNI